jgi:hypothetical protein
MDCRVKPGNDRETFKQKSPGDISGTFVVSTLANRSLRYVLVRIRIMKLSKLSSATCIQASESLR